MTKPKAKVCTCTWMARDTKAIGSKISSTGKEPRLGPMVLSMRASTLEERKKASACFGGKISPAIWANSTTITSTVKEPTRGATVVNTWAIGNATKCTAAEFSHGEMAANTLENTVTTKSTGTASSSGLTDAITRENGKTENKTAKAST